MTATISDLTARVEAQAATHPTYAAAMRRILHTYPDAAHVEDTDVFVQACKLVSYQVQTQSPDDWSSPVELSFDPGETDPDGQARFVADPLDWLDFWAPITEVLYRWEMWSAEASAADRDALEQAVQAADLGDSVAAYLSSSPDDFDAWPDHYDQLLNLAHVPRRQVAPA